MGKTLRYCTAMEVELDYKLFHLRTGLFSLEPF